MSSSSYVQIYNILVGVLWRRDLQNCGEFLLKTNICRKFMIRHWRWSTLFLLVYSKKIVLKKFWIDSAASTGGQGKIISFGEFPCPPLEAGLQISTFFSFLHVLRSYLFFLYQLFLCSVELRKKLPTIKHQQEHLSVFIKNKML